MSWILNVINFFSPEQWAWFGGAVAVAVGTWGITALVKIRHFRKQGEKLWQGYVNLNVAFWPVVLTFIGAALANLDQMTSLLSLIPIAAPYAAQYGPGISVTLLTTHTVVTAIAKFWMARKANRPLSEHPFLNPTYVAPTLSGQPSSSMGTEATARPVQPELIQL